jgi:oligosaccharide repeat unit polymerase
MQTKILTQVTRAESGAVVFATVLALIYGVLPVVLYWTVTSNPYYRELACVTAIGVPCIIVGSRFGILDRVARTRAKLAVGTVPFLMLTWTLFLAFVLVACVTAEKIPLVAAVQGADADTLAVLRERFLKAREGWQSSFVYINLLFAGALIPYSLMLAILKRHRLRWVLFALFTVYCISFVEKVFFLKAVIPLIYLAAQRRISSARPRVLIGAALGVLVLVTVISGAGARGSSATGDEFVSTSFATSGVGEFLVWRAVVVPIVTAADTLLVFEQEYGSRPLFGATNSLLAGVLGLDRVNIERQVYAVQWGQNETETGNSNSVYLTEAYVNFGYVGVALYSFLVGIILRVFAKSEDEALRSLWMLFSFGILFAPLTSSMFSAGFALVIGISLFVRFGRPGGSRVNVRSVIPGAPAAT